MNIKKKLSKRLTSLLIMVILGFSFLGVVIPRVFAANPTITFETTNFCTGQVSFVVCGTSADGFGVINQFTPSSSIGQGLIAVFYCNPGGASPTFTINSVVDTLGDTWTFAQSLVVGSNQFQGTYSVFAFITNIVTNSAASFHITFNASPSAFLCNEELYLSSTGLSITTFASSSVLQYVGTGASQVNDVTYGLTGNNNPNYITPQNTFTFEMSFLNVAGTETLTFTQFNNGGVILQLLKTGSLSASGFPTLASKSYYSFNPNIITTGYQISWRITNTVSAYHYGIGLLVLILNPYSTTTTSGVNTKNCTGSNCSITGGGSTIDQTTTFSLKANSTYYYYGTTGKGGLILQNVTTKVASYTNGAGGKATDTYQLAIYSMKTGNNITGFSLINNQFHRIYNVNRTISTGQTNQWGHAGYINVNIPANTSYAVSFITKFSGLKLYNTISPSVNLLNSSEGTFSGATWSPPYLLSQTNTAPFNVFLEFTGFINPINTIITLTTTTNTSCVAGATCTLATTSTWVTVTSVINNLQGGTGGIAIIQNLIYYWPIWMLPLLSIPFGIQGILVGFIFGVILASLEGIIPLWAAFMLGLGTLYLLSKRF